MTQIRSEVLSVRNLLRKGCFAVPWHQRYYDWTTEQVTELFSDLKEAFDEDRASYFLGSIMLVNGDSEREWEINDGQQRLITLSLLFEAFRRKFSRRRATDAGREILCCNMLFDRPESTDTNLDDTTREVPRIQPPRHDRSRFTQIIRGHDIGTNGKLTSAWKEIDRSVGAMEQRITRNFFEFFIENVEIGILYVPKTEDANAVFEALNGRGKQLDDVDLIRNHLYSYFTSPVDSQRRTTVHEQLENVLATTRSASRSQEYFRCFFQCKYGYLQKKRFYRDARVKIRGPARQRDGGDYVYDLVRELSDPGMVELFRTITSPNPSQELIGAFCAASNTRRNKRNLPVFLRELRNYKVAHPLMFALLRRYVEADRESRKGVSGAVHRCLRDLCSFVIRISFCEAKFEPSRLEPHFANCAKKITGGTSISSITIIKDIEECDDLMIMDDQRFISRLVDVRMTDSRRAKRLLFGVNARYEREVRALDYEGCTVEHILPQSPEYWPHWKDFASAGPDLRDWVSRIGNLTLLGDSDNYGRRRFNRNFGSKKQVFEDSPISITRKISSFDNWTPDVVNERSAVIAKDAARVWSFSSSSRNSNDK